MNSVMSWFGKYWNAVVLLLLIAGAIAIILLWPSKAEEPFNAQSEPLHMTPFAYAGDINYVVLYGFFAFLFLVILCFLGYIVSLLRKKESVKVPEPMEKEAEQKDEEW